MLIYFHRKKANYDKGQVAPFFIFLLVVLIIMALMSANLNKVALLKTNSSNAADAGALGAGSVMANVFNAVAHASDQMDVSYQQFAAGTAAAMAIAIFEMGMAIGATSGAIASTASAEGLACPVSCAALATTAVAIGLVADAIAGITAFISGIIGIMVGIAAFHVAQSLYFENVRDQTIAGRESAVQLGHKLAFSNSNLGSMLIEGLAPETPVGSAENYRRSFSAWLKGVEYNNAYNYAWLDGQSRDHNVATAVAIDTVSDFSIKVAVMPVLEILDQLGTALGLAIGALTPLAIATPMLSGAEVALDTACVAQTAYEACCYWPCFVGCWGYAVWVGTCVGAEGLLGGAQGSLGAAVGLMAGATMPVTVAGAGLIPGRTISDRGTIESRMDILVHIEGVLDGEGNSHNREVRVDIGQHHAGADLGLWRMRYPDTHSMGKATFRGNGSIWPPVRRYDADMIETDVFSK